MCVSVHRRKAIFELLATVHRSAILCEELLHAEHLIPVPHPLSFRVFLKEPEDLVNPWLRNLDSLEVLKDTAEKALDQEENEPKASQ